MDDPRLAFLEAAERVLSTEGKPLSVEEITQRALKLGLLSTKGKTPEYTMAASLYVDVKRNPRRTVFSKLGHRRFGLVRWETVTRQASSKGIQILGTVESGEKPKKEFTFKSVASSILDRTKKPMTAQEITETALDEGILETRGKTPSHSMAAQLYVDIKRNQDKSEFVQLGKNLFGLRSWDISVLEPKIKIEEQREITTELQGLRKRSIVGDPINIEGLIYGPLNENGVIFLFSKIQDKLAKPITIEAIQPAYPDAKGRRKTEKGWVDVWIEFEYKSSHFKLHKHDPGECDIIVCWENDWKSCPLEVIELKSVLSGLV